MILFNYVIWDATIYNICNFGQLSFGNLTILLYEKLNTVNDDRLDNYKFDASSVLH